METDYLTKIPYADSSINVLISPFRGTYPIVAEEIDSRSLKMPDSKEVISFLYDTVKNEELYSEKVKNVLRNNFLWEFTGNLYLPKSNREINNGIILEYNPSIEKGKLVMNKSSLIKRLFRGDPLVKFVPFGFKTGRQSVKQLEKNPYIIARYGEEGAERVAEIASLYQHNPHIGLFKSTEEETKISGIVDNRDWDGSLNIDAGHFSDFWGIAFGVKKN